MLRVWLIRHGESETNAGAASGDPGVSPLTARGRAQADRLAGAFPEAPALIVHSPYVRAVRTAEPLADRFPDVPREEWPVQEFSYLGMFHDRLSTSEERQPYVLDYWDRADPHLSLGGAESFAALLDRARHCLDRLARQPTGPVAVFTHGTFIRAVAWTLLTADPLDMRAFHRFATGLVIDNGTVVGLRFPAGAPPAVALGVDPGSFLGT
ncbi:histidine phosphatase family protein [Actinophytocola sp.]|uniref:histidine phosphatase family protein n=1 Tax=Actinophytocola sp. TaxID=1872138 RepID=UPI00389B11E2